MARLNWASSRSIGGISEICVLAPIRKGSVPGERRTHEEYLRELIAGLARRHEAGLPTDLDPVTAIHFGRMLILRPEQYLRPAGPLAPSIQRQPGAPPPHDPFDEYVESPISRAEDKTVLNKARDDAVAPGSSRPPRSWLLVLVEFDGELRSYMRDIARSVVAFDRIFEHCDDYPGTRDFEAFWLWIKRYQIGVDLLYTRYPDLPVVRLKYLERFKRRFDAFVSSVRSSDGWKVESLEDAFDFFLRENQQISRGFPSSSGVYPPIKE